MLVNMGLINEEVCNRSRKENFNFIAAVQIVTLKNVNIKKKFGINRRKNLPERKQSGI